MKKRFFCILLVLVMMLSLVACTGGSSSKETYTCGYCGKKMTGAYYDYINGNYACRTCSKERRHN